MEVKSIRSGSVIFVRCDVFTQQIYGCVPIKRLSFPSLMQRELFNIRFSYKNCNFSHFCLLVNMVSKTVTRSIQPCFLHGGSERLACSEPTDAARELLSSI